MPTPSFIHLRVHSAYSLSEGAIKVKELIKLCLKHEMPAVAITDTNNLFGAMEFASAALEAGVQPIIGCQLSVTHDYTQPKNGPDQLVLLVQSDAGYRNLLKLVSTAHLDAGTETPHIELADLEGKSDGLICLSGGPKGPLGPLLQTGQTDAAATLLKHLQALFPNRLYIELQRHGTDEERQQEAGLLDLAYAHEVPLVATNECFFATEDMYEAHDALLCIAGGNYVIEDDRRKVTPEHRFKSAAEMQTLFEDLPEAIANTVAIARRCSFLLKPIQPILPRFGSAAGEAAMLREKALEGLELRLAQHVYTTGMDEAGKIAAAKPYRERLDFELGVIEGMKFPGYFLIVADFIQWAKGQGIPVGPGRGSGAGSVVAWVLTITDLDPLRFGLLFERFLNPERVSMPDFDIDFCQDRRDEVIDYVRQKHGHDRVAQIITFGKLQARAVLRDVGRVLQMSYGQVDRICKMVPNNPAKPVTLAEAIESEPALQAMRDEDEQVGRLIRIGLQLEGLYRHASTHAAGVVIGDRPLVELIPLYRDPKSEGLVTQFSMKYVEQAGLVKFDFLGLKTLTVLRKAEELVKATGIDLDLETLPFDDTKTFELLTRAEGGGVFQLESSGMRDALRRLKPNRIEDIIALVALYRPGPMENIPRYCRIKDGTEEPDYLHPSLEKVLKETFGIIVYQEQVMEIAQVLAGYSLGTADLLRRAMGKKIRAEMEAQRETFAAGAKAKGIDPTQAGAIFDLVAKFADYGFNKSHAAAYALIAYQTAWMKANYPVEFMAALMTLDMGNTDKLAGFRQELQAMGIALLPPDINRSGVEFAVEEQVDGTMGIRYALGAIKGVGGPAMEVVVAERLRNGVYNDLGDFARRLDGKTLNKRQLEALAHAGAFDTLNGNRAQVCAAAEMIMRQATSAAAEREAGQVNLFGGEAPKLKLPLAAAYDPLERLKREFDAIGFYLSSHPLDTHAKALKRLGVKPSAELKEAARGPGPTRYKLAGVVIARQERTSAKGNRFAFLQLSDVSGVYEVMLFSELLAMHRPLLEAGQTLIVTVDAQIQNEELRLTAQMIEPLDETIGKLATGLRIVIDESAEVEKLRTLLEETLTSRSKINLEIRLPGNQAVTMDLPSGLSLPPKARMALEEMSGVLAVEDL
jgi:DNA polymerase-3 subunit alpha